METLLTYLAQAKVSSEPRIMAEAATNPLPPPTQGQSGRLSPQEHHWHTNPALLPEHWIRQQQDYREHALAIMLSCNPPPAVKAFLQKFLVPDTGN